MSSPRNKLKIEWFKNERWQGVSDDSMLHPDTIESALDYLSKTPERYFYPTVGRRIRISFNEP